ncbi:polyketide cyclase/dehydrase/lipid transport protein [Kribbella voronezhensis]|uniref:Polyketide cyclase/dehydrase/lipid transport protein n=1 Tax=Kribbella voronezhensis TaxID=2512212 RepID=A0A4R7TDK9_9ACTN|nr:SRPBCC family protein [Kribbella voronezhensis]TDU89437.1 polyketide cyclase/dehydrase/lipid transport protein [Kribbella voronezhensis]
MEEAVSHIPADPAAIRHALLDALSLPEWNEAFLAIDGPADAAVGVRYVLRVRPGLTGHLEYTVIQADRIDFTWQVPGFHETSSWVLGPDGTVTHSFEQSGPLAAVLRPAYRGIAAVRLDRLANRVAQLSRAA